MEINRFIPLYSTQSGAVPTASALYVGELAVNTADGKLFTRHEDYVVALNDTTNFVSSSGQVVALINGQNITPLSVLADSFTGSFTGSFYGNGNGLIFNQLNTSQSANSTLVVGNVHNNYQYKQTTVFKNGDIVVSGSATIAQNGILVLTPQTAPLPATAGGLFVSTSGELFVGI